MKEVQLAGGTSETEDYYIGAERELRVDTSNDELRLHDGSTPGGKRFKNIDQLETVFQEKSPELDGFDFSAQGKGWLVRVGPGNYKLRSLTVNEEQLEITNPYGTLGNPKIGLLETILSDHTWAGTHTFEQPVTGEAGFVGNLTGNVTGNVTGDLTGDVTGNVTGDLQGNTFGTHTGSLDTTAGEVAMADGQIQYDWLSDEIKGMFTSRGIPFGCILMWSGAADDVPESFQLCDGTGSTPDLRDKFVIGAGGAYAVDSEGGATTHSHSGASASSGAFAITGSTEEHILDTDEIPAHRHLMAGSSAGGTVVGDTIDTDSGFRGKYDTGGGFSYNLRYSDDGPDRAGTSQTGGSQGHAHAINITSGAHTHGITVDAASSLPPYYALAYIMKVA